MKRNKASASSSKGRKDGEGRAEDPYCSVCMSDEFYEDEQGGMICVACGTQSQDFLAEGFDEDDLAVYGGGMGNIVTLKNASGKGMKAAEETKTKKVSLIPDVLEALKLYQFVLQMVFDACLTASNISNANINDVELNAMNATYRNTLKSVWLEYLNRWNTDQRYTPPQHTDSDNDKRARFKQPSKCSLGAGFTRSAKHQCKCRDVGSIHSHPLFPSKPLLLGFVYLTYRIMRSDVLISDIVRWCEAGVVPYANLWENIPQRWRDSVKVDMKWFFDTTNKRVFVTPSTVLFHACNIAQVIRVEPAQVQDIRTLHANSNTSTSTKYTSYDAEMPPLNAPLVAHKLLTTLGLPPIVWDMYVKITQMFTAGVPIHGAHVLEQHHELHIMAALIVAVKFSPRWTEWVLVSNTSMGSSVSISSSSGEMYAPYKQATLPATSTTDSFAMPETIADINTVTRAQLPLLLAQIRRINQLHTLHTDTHKMKFMYNTAVFAALGGDLEKINKGEGQYASEDTYLSQAHTTPYNTAHNSTPYRTPRSAHTALTARTPYTPYTQHTPHTAHRSLHTAEVPTWSGTSTTDSTFRMSSVVCGECMVTEDLPLKDTRKLNYLNGIEPYQNSSKHTTRANAKHTNMEKSVYMAYTRYDSDRTSLHHLPYIVLLERCAKYLYVNPQLLHELVTDMEKQIVSLAFTGTTSNTSTTTATTTTAAATSNKRSKKISITHAVTDTDRIKHHISAKERDMHSYRLKSNQILPQLHNFGASGVGVNIADYEYSVAGERGSRAVSGIGKKRKAVVVKIEGTHYDSSQQYTLHTAEDADDHSINSNASVRHEAANSASSTTSATMIQKAFTFHPATDCIDIEGVFGSDNVIHRVDSKRKQMKRSKKNSASNTANTSNTTASTAANTTSTSTAATTADATQRTPTTSHYTDYTSNTSGNDSDGQGNSPQRNSPRVSPQHEEFDLLHSYTTAHAGQVTPPISELTYSRTPFSAFNTTKGVSLVERSVRSVQGAHNSRNKHGAAMEALDRLVSAQDSESESAGGGASSDSSVIVDVSEDENDVLAPLTQPHARNTRVAAKAPRNSLGSHNNTINNTSNHIFGDMGHANNTRGTSSGTGSVFNMGSTPILPIASTPAASSHLIGGSSTGGFSSMLARAIYGTPASSQATSAPVSTGVANRVEERPVVSLKRPRHSVQFEKKLNLY